MPQYVPLDRVEEHFATLHRRFPTLTRTHLAALAGVSSSTLTRRDRKRISLDVEERVLAVQPRHVALMPPRHMPRDAVVAHIESLVSIPRVSRNLIAKLAGVSYQTLYNIASGVSVTVEYRTYAAIMAVTPDMVIANTPLRDPRLTVTRIRALEANGWPLTALSAMLGFPVRDIAIRTQYVGPSVEARVKALYDSLGDEPGPAKVAARHARRLGYLPPIFYDDDMFLIEAAEQADDLEQADARYRLCVLAHALAGWRDQRIAEKYGVSTSSVQKVRQRAGLLIEPETALTARGIAPGQEWLVQRIQAAVDGIAWREAIECLDDEGIDYVARWEAVGAAQEPVARTA